MVMRSSFRPARLAAVVSGVLLAGAVSAPTAMAAPTCTTIGAVVACIYNAGGSTQVAVPAGATSVSVVADGGGGGGGAQYAAGKGAHVTATLDVVGLSTLTVVVAAPGAASPSFNVGGSGGGFTALYAGSTTTASNVLVVAGGGGGGGSNASGSASTGGAAGSISNGDGGLPGGVATVPGGGGGGGTGAGGSGGAPTVAGSNGSAGSSWTSGGAGGAGASYAGSGGAGYGGGGGGGYATGSGSAAGGAGGGSYVDSVRGSSIVYATRSGSGAPANAAGLPGSILLTFLLAPTPAGDEEAVTPAPWLQSYGRAATGTCRSGWHASWAEWAIDKTGGWVCNRTIYWSGGRWYESPDAVWGPLTPGSSQPWSAE